MSLYIPKMSDTPGVTIPGLASNFNALADSRIVEQGSNENGEYRRWENGLQICWVRKASDRQYSSELALDWTFPAGFDVPPVVVQLEDRETSVTGGLSNVYVDTRGLSATRVTVSYRPRTGTFSSGDIIHSGLLAIGRWK